MHDRIIRLLFLEIGDRLERLVELLLADTGGDQGHVGGHALVLGGDLFEIGESLSGMTGAHARQGQRGLGLPVFRIGLGCALEILFRRLHVTALHVGIARQGQPRRAGFRAVQHRLQGFHRLGRLAAAQIGHDQRTAAEIEPGCFLQGLAQVFLRLHVGAVFVGDQAGELEALGVLGLNLQQTFDGAARGRNVLAAIGRQALHVEGERVIGTRLLHCVELLACKFRLAVAQVDHDQRCMRRKRTRIDFDPFFVSSDSICALAFSTQHVSLEQPRIGIFCILGEDVVNEDVRTLGIIADDLESRHAQQSWGEIALRRNGFFECSACCIELALHRQALRDGGLEVGQPFG